MLIEMDYVSASEVIRSSIAHLGSHDPQVHYRKFPITYVVKATIVASS